MVGIVIVIIFPMEFPLSGRLRSTSPPPATSAVTSGLSEATAFSGHPSSTTTTAQGSRISTWMATPTHRFTTTGATAVLSVVYSASMGIH